jgi:glycerol-3-phosphate dehydrogenase (NAD(P)+)
VTTVSILGSGIMGTALTFPLSDNGHDVRLVGTFLDREIIDSIKKTGVHPRLNRKVPETVRAYQLESAEEAFEGAEVAMSGVNSFGVRWAGKQFASLLRPGMHVLSIAKGMEASEYGDLHILPEVLAEDVPPELREQVSWSAIAGPCIAGELAARRDTCVVFASRNASVAEELASLFRTSYYHVWTSDDFVGVEGCAAAKNCYALGAGFADGILERLGEAEGTDRNYNYTAALFGQGAAELGQLMQLLGGRPETPYGLAGVGDLYVTSMGGRNVRVGRLVGTGVRFSEARARMPGVTLEGAAAIVVIGGALSKLTEREIIAPEDFPLMRHLHAVIAEDQPLDMPWSTFFGGEPQKSKSKKG